MSPGDLFEFFDALVVLALGHFVYLAGGHDEVFGEVGEVVEHAHVFVGHAYHGVDYQYDFFLNELFGKEVGLD